MNAALAPIYSRAQLLVPIAIPPIVVAVIPIACAICSSVSLRSFAVSAAPLKATNCEACTPPLVPPLRRRAVSMRPDASHPTTIAHNRSRHEAPVRADGAAGFSSRLCRRATAGSDPGWVVRVRAAVDGHVSAGAAGAYPFTRATELTGSLAPSNQIVASGFPP